mgnify:CR=1 FL=1
MNNILDGFGDERRLKPFFDSGVVGFMELSELIRNSDDERKGSFEKENNSGQLCQDTGPWSINNSWFVEDFKIFLYGAVGPF